MSKRRGPPRPHRSSPGVPVDRAHDGEGEQPRCLQRCSSPRSGDFRFSAAARCVTSTSPAMITCLSWPATASRRSITSSPHPSRTKGAILTQISNFWFEKTAHIIANHIVDPNPGPRVVSRDRLVLPRSRRPDGAGAQRPAAGDRGDRPWISVRLRLEGVPEAGDGLRPSSCRRG